MTRNTFFAALMAAALGLVPGVARAQTPPPTQSTPPVKPPQAPPATANPTAPASTPTVGQSPADAPPLAPTTPPPGMKSLIIQRVLVKVNGQAFTQTDLELAQTQALAASNVQAKVKEAPTDAVLQKQLLQITPGILVAAINDMLIIEKAHELGYKMSDDQYQKYVDDLKTQNHLDDAGFKKAVADQGMSMDDLHKQIEHSYLQRAVEQSEIMGHSQMTEEEAQQYYKAHTAEFMNPAHITLREILISVPTENVGGQPSFNAGTDEAIRAKADAIRDRLLKGEDFAKVAAEVSDSATKANGGLLGDVNEADMAEAIRPILDALKPGEITAPIRTARGYQILKLEARVPTQPRPFAEVHDQIGQKIYQERLGGEAAKYYTKLRAEALIEWKDESLKAMYEKELADEKKAGTDR